MASGTVSYFTSGINPSKLEALSPGKIVSGLPRLMMATGIEIFLKLAWVKTVLNSGSIAIATLILLS